MKFIQKQPFLD